MKFFFPDSQDVVDPGFDFEREDRAADRVRQRSETYAHEVFTTRVYDGLLLSKGLVDRYGSAGRISIAQRQRLLRVGAPEFFRVDGTRGRTLPMMGDCGAFAYVREKEPPYSVDDVLNFYTQCKFDYGLSVDHVILGYTPELDETPEAVAPDVRQRQQLTLQLASEFRARHLKEKLTFEPLGVAQGWSPQSYAHSVKILQDMGYCYIALGGRIRTTEGVRSKV